MLGYLGETREPIGLVNLSIFVIAMHHDVGCIYAPYTEIRDTEIRSKRRLPRMPCAERFAQTSYRVNAPYENLQTHDG